MGVYRRRSCSATIKPVSDKICFRGAEAVHYLKKRVRLCKRCGIPLLRKERARMGRHPLLPFRLARSLTSLILKCKRAV
jgi:hypothetical protein